MPVPVLKPQEVASILAKLGFVEVRQRGSCPLRDHVRSIGNAAVRLNPLVASRPGQQVVPATRDLITIDWFDFASRFSLSQVGQPLEENNRRKNSYYNT